jgi:hypothetical protein
MIHPFTTPHLETMAWTIDRDGIDAIPPAVLRELGFVATRAGVSTGIGELLADPSAPAPVRNRAFGFVARHLARFQPSPRDADDDTTTPSGPTEAATHDAGPRVPCAA